MNLKNYIYTVTFCVIFASIASNVAYAKGAVSTVRQSSYLPTGAVVITGNAQGTTGAVVGTLAASTVGKTTFICGLRVDATGSGAIGPVTLAGIVGGPMVFQGSAAAANDGVPAVNFFPCIPATAPDTAITLTTSADGTATAVDVNTWGYQQ